MLININGEIREMTPEEEAEAFAPEGDSIEERLYTLEEAMAILLGVKE